MHTACGLFFVIHLTFALAGANVLNMSNAMTVTKIRKGETSTAVEFRATERGKTVYVVAYQVAGEPADVVRIAYYGSLASGERAQWVLNAPIWSAYKRRTDAVAAKAYVAALGLNVKPHAQRDYQ